MHPAPTRSRAVVLALLACLVTACGAGAAPVTGVAVPDGAVSIGLQFAPRSGLAIDTDDAFVLTQLGAVETLVAVDGERRPQPGLATQWTQTEPTTWRFTLRPGVTFHDGTPLTAEAVVGALTYLTGVAAPPRAIAGAALTAEADGDAVLVRTADPDPILPLRLSAPGTAILAPSAYAGDGPPSVVGTGTGLLRITEADAAQGITLERFEQYWGERARVASVTARFLTDPTARALAFRAGDVDIVLGLPEPAVLELQSTPDVEVQTVPTPRTASLYLNGSAPPFSDVRVRRAVALAVDRTALAEQALAGSGLPASEIFGPAVPWGGTGPVPPHDPAAAADLLAQAGFGPDNPVTVRLWTYANRPELPTLATAVQAMLSGAGITAEIQIGEYAAQEPELLAGRYDMMVLSRNLLTDLPDAAGVLSSDYSCSGTYNLNRFCSPEFDALVAGLVEVPDPAARQDTFARAARLLEAESVGVPLVHTVDSSATRGVTGFVPDPAGRVLVTSELARTG
ncbi:ABC transporter substrate-binding protein [Pseudonocardia abyssalis]|uniref:ABC transporter substrate-binding protein n=1 Tax=Pseudonocardia abyssalis TaxID=2792008 RepID=A0ABS6UMZ7_9PSEU|nr:ABC transporter substrate-binding protein [Pseudonocardia abyssalis]MBW0117367.1 ABC transporter substrate-binding protein [Pseudonocardia abyssalis]MBW0133610.1 ABC transporter substrate-binding protein [Pseudonocardia abyssalis]